MSCPRLSLLWLALIACAWIVFMPAASVSSHGPFRESHASERSPIESPIGKRARWKIPKVTRVELDRHDLRWIDCGFTACDELDWSRGNGAIARVAILCTSTPINSLPFVYLGHLHPNQSGAFTTSAVISRTNIGWLDGPRYTYRLGERIYVLTEANEAIDQLNLFFTMRAFELLRVYYPDAYDQLVSQTANIPNEPPPQKRPWKNRTRSLLISFDTSPKNIAAGVTVLDAAPKRNAETGLLEYSNVDVISIDRETILGQDQFGSRPLYGKVNPEENYLRYMREGLIETLVHELLHRQIDRLSSIDDRMNELRERRTSTTGCEVDALEELLVASTSLDYFRKQSGLGENILDYHDKVLSSNEIRIRKCHDYLKWKIEFSQSSSREQRYKMRLFDMGTSSN